MRGFRGWKCEPGRSSRVFCRACIAVPYFGQSVEFVQHRGVRAGGRLPPHRLESLVQDGQYYIKQYEEDTNLRTHLLVDVSESMSFGTGAMTKYDYACTVAAALAYLLLRSRTPSAW